MIRLLSKLTLPLAIFVAGTAMHPAAATTPVNLLSFGENTYGQTGLGTRVSPVTVPRLIDASNLGGLKITQAAAGFDHSLLLADDGATVDL